MKRPPRPNKKQIDAKFDLTSAMTMRANGDTLDTIAKHFGISKSSVHARMPRPAQKGAKPTKAKRLPGKTRLLKGERKKCNTCKKLKTINAKNFGNSTKSADGFMHICRTCLSAKQVEAQARAKKRRQADVGAELHKDFAGFRKDKDADRAEGLEDAQRALDLANTGIPDTDGEALWLLKGAAMMEGITLIELVQRMLSAYRSAA